MVRTVGVDGIFFLSKQANNKISSIKGIEEATQLVKLVLAHNNISSIAEGFSRDDEVSLNIMHLDLRDNMIGSVEDLYGLAKLPRLRTLLLAATGTRTQVSEVFVCMSLKSLISCQIPKLLTN